MGHVLPQTRANVLKDGQVLTAKLLFAQLLATIIVIARFPTLALARKVGVAKIAQFQFVHKTA